MGSNTDMETTDQRPVWQRPEYLTAIASSLIALLGTIGVLTAGEIAPQKAGLVVPATVTGAAGAAIHVRAGSPAVVFKWLPGSAGLDVFQPSAGTDQSQCVVRAVAPGTYRLWCVACLGDVMAAKSIAVVVTGPPGPGPPPDPPPVPVATGKLWIVIIETPAGAANRGQLLNDPALQALAKSKGHRFRIVDSSVVGPDGKPPADVAPYLRLAAGKMLPQLFLVTEAGVQVYAGELPATADALAALLRKAGG